MAAPIQGDSMFELFVRRVAISGEAPALWTYEEGQFRSCTWNDLAADVAAVAASLRRLGVSPGERVAVELPNCHEWIVADLAIAAIGAVSVPLHVTYKSEERIRLLEHSGAKRSIRALGGELFEPAYNNDDVSLVDLIGCSEIESWEFLTVDAAPLAPFSSPKPEDLATIVYTSGTTGHPKGVMLSHRNLAFDALALVEAFDDSSEDRRLTFLPFSHLYARTCDLYTWIILGNELVLARSRETILDDCKLMRPTLINGVPYFYQKVADAVRAEGKIDQPGTLQKMLGGRIKMFACGGAPLADYAADIFAKQESPVRNGYGLSESAPVISASSRRIYRPRSVGRALPGVEVRIADDGEVLTRGPHVMQGYYKDAAATAEVIDGDGWLHTGDLGHLDDDQFLFITGRKKELIVTATGKKVAPAQIESALASDPLIAQAIVVGEGKNFLAALVVPNPEALREFIRQKRLWVFSKRGALRHRKVLAVYRERIDRLLADHPKHEQIVRFTLLGRGFTPDSGEMTPKLSLRRELIQQNCAAEIAALYR
ncbi:AMP-dependent synthetase/ligase [Blastopirellula retiformator]|uniref:Long-chain-fatty-acid--CoA ligase FadD15 n=1 Tax=Blastopirellula retiformator TaxID=2527970 RepID=A0A5C5UX40_9BACT|nr:AMP-dependent synthetase/ligase [Blastopirellula retiformator]TWT30758.1 Long-chain-fatty-acid--CoA ligase FadD15 [Blastopirellula retiformator]